MLQGTVVCARVRLAPEKSGGTAPAPSMTVSAAAGGQVGAESLFACMRYVVRCPLVGGGPTQSRAWCPTALDKAADRCIAAQDALRLLH